VGQGGGLVALEGAAALGSVDDDEKGCTPPAAAASTFALTAGEQSNDNVGFAGSFVATPEPVE